MDDIVQTFAERLPDATPDELFAGLHELCDATLGVRLFTCSRFDIAAGKAERIYTSDDDAYPLTGLKDIVPNRWTRIVLDDRQPFLSETIEGLRDVFPDHEKIEALGLGAAINLPVIVCGNILGTANLLDVDHKYTEDARRLLPPLTTCAALAFLGYLSIERVFSRRTGAYV